MARHGDLVQYRLCGRRVALRAFGLDLFQRPAQSTLTFRNNDQQTALPVRQWGSFQPGNGVGGAGVHWGRANLASFQPTDFRMRSHLTERYGASFIPQELSIQDWGITFEELEPYYDRFEYLAGISGKAGNINGRHSGRRQPVRRTAQT